MYRKHYAYILLCRTYNHTHFLEFNRENGSKGRPFERGVRNLDGRIREFECISIVILLRIIMTFNQFEVLYVIR